MAPPQYCATSQTRADAERWLQALKLAKEFGNLSARTTLRGGLCTGRKVRVKKKNARVSQNAPNGDANYASNYIIFAKT